MTAVTAGNHLRVVGRAGLVLFYGLSFAAAQTPSDAPGRKDPLPSWNSGAAKNTIVNFVNRVTTTSGRDFVPPAERIATFDNDGTLWTEHPIYVQFAFALDRIRALAARHPEWKQQQPYKAAIEGDMKSLVVSIHVSQYLFPPRT